MFALFIVFGLAVSTWAVHIPSIQQQTGISTAILGTMLLVLGAGALVGMQITGPMITRFGGGTTGVVAGAAMSILLVGPMLATDETELLVGLTLFGLAMGGTDVSMNAQAVVVEQDYERSIMSAFHAVFSVGSVIGSLIGAATLAVEWSMTTTAVVMSGTCLLITLAVATHLVRFSRPTRPVDETGSTPVRTRTVQRRLVVLGALAFLLFLSEGAAMDWSSVHAQEHLGASEAVGALTFGAFVTMMTVGRFSADRVAQRRGGQWVVRVGCAVGCVGMGIVLLSPVVPLTMVGWAIFGLGLSGSVPQVLSTAGNLDGTSGTDFSRVVGLGYGALLAGPALIGWLAEHVPINTTMLIPLCAIAICCAAAGNIGR
ncbi:MFS transporter [Rhodococcus sp. NPDC056960]|uniref:MFS transporter n=1 Tax=Rhodococcus sp. NPDC056960 TaxID=3345982 RepID=UPI00362979D5